MRRGKRDELVIRSIGGRSWRSTNELLARVSRRTNGNKVRRSSLVRSLDRLMSQGLTEQRLDEGEAEFRLTASGEAALSAIRLRSQRARVV